jgi:hypothetical protein
VDQAQFESLLHTIDQMIGISEPRTAEYYRGYRLGIQLFQYRAQSPTEKELLPLHESYAVSGDHYVDFYSRGYRDGCRGLTPDP